MNERKKKEKEENRKKERKDTEYRKKKRKKINNINNNSSNEFSFQWYWRMIGSEISLNHGKFICTFGLRAVFFFL